MHDHCKLLTQSVMNKYGTLAHTEKEQNGRSLTERSTSWQHWIWTTRTCSDTETKWSTCTHREQNGTHTERTEQLVTCHCDHWTAHKHGMMQKQAWSTHTKYKTIGHLLKERTSWQVAAQRRGILNARGSLPKNGCGESIPLDSISIVLMQANSVGHSRMAAGRK